MLIYSISEIFSGINFCQCGKDSHILCVFINTGQKIHVIKFSPMRAGGEIDKVFIMANISSYTILAPSTCTCTFLHLYARSTV